MVRSSQATTLTFSSSPYFDDRGPHGYAEPITERVNVRFSAKSHTHSPSNTPPLASFASCRFILLPKRRRCTALWGKLHVLKPPHEKCLLMYMLQEHHPMKPHRLTLTNALVLGYGLDKQIHNIYSPRPATQAELEAYHDHDYIEFLSRYVLVKYICR